MPWLTTRRTTRLGALAGVVVAGVLLGSPAATAAPEIEVRAASAPSADVVMSIQVLRRQQALEALNRKAAARDRELAREKARLADYGYSGDLDDATHVLPLASYSLSAGFGASGPMWEATHTGLDMSTSSGDTLVSIADAVVLDVSYAGPYGLRTRLQLSDGTELWYCHQLAALVSPGEAVELAEPIGLVGSTGNSSGPHLHLEVRPGGGGPVDPLDWLRSHGLSP